MRRFVSSAAVLAVLLLLSHSPAADARGLRRVCHNNHCCCQPCCQLWWAYCLDGCCNSPQFLGAFPDERQACRHCRLCGCHCAVILARPWGCGDGCYAAGYTLFCCCNNNWVAKKTYGSIPEARDMCPIKSAEAGCVPGDCYIIQAPGSIAGEPC